MATLSRTPSPAARSSSDADSVVATPMTPRTKLRALLASVDSDSDQENVSPGKGKKSKASMRTTTMSTTNNSDNDDSESDVEVRPRGRFAARMQAVLAAAPAAATQPEEDDDDDLPAAGDARERVKRMLAQQQKREQKNKEDANNDTTGNASSDDEMVPRRRLIHRGARSSPAAAPKTPVREAAAARAASLSSSPDDVFITPMQHRQQTPGSGADSPGMFMTPTKDGAPGTATIAIPQNRHARFQALVARKREEARLREKAEEAKRAARQAVDEDDIMDDLADLVDDDDASVLDIADDEGGLKLTQSQAPSGRRGPAARKASKKALEEMHRETQRMARGLQLAHEAKTRKKVTKAALFERFHFRAGGGGSEGSEGREGAPIEEAKTNPPSSSRPTSPVSPRSNADAGADAAADADTPPSSPPPTVLDKGKGKAIETAAPETAAPATAPKRLRVVLPPPQTTNLVLVDDDDNAALEIVATARNKLDALFDRAPRKREQEPRSLLALRRLAQIRSPGRAEREARQAKLDMTLGDLELSLQERARQQARREREARLAALRAKGVQVVTEAEREQELAEVEDIVARARQEGEALTRREREAAKAAKKARRARGEDVDDGEDSDPLAWDDSEDDSDYDAGANHEEEERVIELSGSSEEEDEGEDEGEDEEVDGALIDGEAEQEEEEGEEEEANIVEDVANVDDDAQPTQTGPRRKRRAPLVLDDSDEEVDYAPNTPSITGAATPMAKTARALFATKTPSRLETTTRTTTHSDSPQAPTSVLRSASKPFIPGVPVAAGAPAGMGLTQIFAGTLGGSQGSQGGSPAPSDFLPPTFDVDMPAMPATPVPDSQPPSTQEWLLKMQQRDGGADNTTQSQSQAVQFASFSQSQVHGLDSLLDDDADLMRPTQGDAVYTPLKVRFVGEAEEEAEMATQAATDVPATVDTVVMATPEAQQPPRRRLVRKAAAAAAAADESDDETVDDQFKAAAAAAAAATARAKHVVAAAFDRKKSKAKDLVEDQAEESEDEYAGLGGADGEDEEDDDNRSLASVEDLIDDEQKATNGDRAALAAFYADRERAQDEKQVEKLFRDVTTGQLRRKRGGGGGDDAFGLSDDSDGDYGAAARRRRAKRRQFARMQQALFADERVSKVAANPRNQAFLRTMEDRGSDDEMDFLWGEEKGKPTETTTTESEASGATTPVATVAPAAPAAVAIPDSQPAALPPATTHVRRPSVDVARKPKSLGEIRASLSHLLGDDDGRGGERSALSVVAESEYGSDDEENNHHNNHTHPRRTPAVVDRISLKRGSSSSSVGSTTSSTGSRPGFRVPALLRRATTNSSLASTASSSSSTTTANTPAGSALRKNASTRSGIHSFARASERRAAAVAAAAAAAAARRQARQERSAAGRIRAVGELFGGKFE